MILRLFDNIRAVSLNTNETPHLNEVASQTDKWDSLNERRNILYDISKIFQQGNDTLIDYKTLQGY